GANTTAVFIVRVSQAGPNDTYVDYATADGSARAPADYVTDAGTVVIPAGLTSTTVPITVKGDARAEADENFFLSIGSPPGAAVSDNGGEARIIDDDAPPYVSIGDATVVEGDTGTTNAVFPVTLSAASPTNAQVRYATAFDSATADVDYTSVRGTLV